MTRRAARSASDEVEPVRLPVETTCSVRLGSRGARIPKDDRAGVSEVTGHLKLMPMQATPIHQGGCPRCSGLSTVHRFHSA